MDPSNTALLVMMSVHHLSTAHTWRLYRRSGDFISCRGNGSECTPDQSDTLQPTVQTGHQQSFSWTRMCASSISQPAYQCRRTRATQRRLSPAAWSEHSAFSSGYASSLLHMHDTLCVTLHKRPPRDPLLRAVEQVFHHHGVMLSSPVCSKPSSTSDMSLRHLVMFYCTQDLQRMQCSAGQSRKVQHAK